MNGRGSKIRTCDPLVPNQVRYQTAPCPDNEMINYDFKKPRIDYLRPSADKVKTRTGYGPKKFWLIMKQERLQ